MLSTKTGSIVGLISGVISIIEATKTLYDVTKDAKDQREAFRQAAAPLPLVIEVLHSAKQRAQTLDEVAQETLEPILESCKAKAKKLKKIFQRVIPKDDDKQYDRYTKALDALGKGDKVEYLMEGLLKDIQVLACETLIGTATDAQVKEIDEAIKTMKEMPSLAAEDEAEGFGMRLGKYPYSNMFSMPRFRHLVPIGDLGSSDQSESLVGFFNGAQVKESEEAIKAVKELPSPLTDEARGLDTNLWSCVNINKPRRDIVPNYNDGGFTNEFLALQMPLLTGLSPEQIITVGGTTDPRDDKKRIEKTNGGVLENSYRWILSSAEFLRWCHDKSRLLYIKGNPGKGKTMLLCGIVNEMSPSTRLRDKDSTTLLSYFFCQVTDSRLNNATAVLRGLIYLLIDQQPSLVSHVLKQYGQGAKRPFEGLNAWKPLSVVFENILQDPGLKSTYLVVDALDECETDLPKFLNLVVQSASTSSRVKWIVSSCNKPDIEAQLRLNDTQVRLSLELNSAHVSRAVKMFIDFKVSQLPFIVDDSTLQEQVRDQIYAKANGTFLWAALVLKELERVESWNVLDVLREFPPELDPLYERMIRQIQPLQRNDPELCRLVLCTMALSYRPLLLLELETRSGLPKQISNNLENVKRVVDKCRSFLTMQEDHVYFVHPSAKDFLLGKALNEMLPSSTSALSLNPVGVGRAAEREVENSSLPNILYRLHLGMLRLLRPRLDAGHRRLEWQCNCGMPLYGDFRGDNNEIDKLVMEMQAHGFLVTQSGHGATRLLADSRQTTASNSAPLAPPISNTSQATRSSSIYTSQGVGVMPNTTVGGIDTAAFQSTSTGAGRKFVALCVSSGPFKKTYDEVDISSIPKDTQMFRGFKLAYEACRSSRMNVIRKWLIKPVNINYTQFAVGILKRVYPIAGPPDCTICAHAENKDDLVDMRRYERQPAASSLTHPPIPPDLFFHLWECPRGFTPAMQSMWLNRLPTKLYEKLDKVCLGTRPDGEIILGWGVLVIEGINKRSVLRWTGGILALAIVISTVYSAITGDVSSGFAIGALIVACWAVFVTSLCTEFQES
ncbi:uncharacterized protein BP5553_04232 [Venustampulla echinocandica]|uniref:NACHT domain-containing protein n=1 Tax=Venustampulla echinocandica TaxID=2656787 RepID=A0A370TWI5_9HELO|nr:uncharacterized protein BP5553_04232 [Venustampulla echinocandica]RDL39892.1 hypothetical protein BP5553_04232 [Venustampulla echinocandica]